MELGAARRQLAGGAHKTYVGGLASASLQAPTNCIVLSSPRVLPSASRRELVEGTLGRLGCRNLLPDVLLGETAPQELMGLRAAMFGVPVLLGKKCIGFLVSTVPSFR